ncbi:hypothetical protein GPECTOR_10g975 [Gonium pectorale]|uniref:ADP-ribosylglycohydrolase n=1 Tax=Gonium pectorale TaxID=33097 RepID=A0A150GRG1_GONPE|nr:hypothetical protein GPECTOR_10g975 [Gonium pectorale]|eukprot:KXZ52342.1 hypothetical protein GPECTOR_10g975 [Gonium pectorale]
MATIAPVAAPVAAATSVKERAKAAILGGLLADAASMPLHWIYDVPKMQELLASKSREATPEFFPEPSCPFYKHPFGALSPYGHELIPLLTSMADNGGELDEHKYAEALHRYFTVTEPEAYRNKSVRSVVAGWEEGRRGREVGDKDDFQANCFAKPGHAGNGYSDEPLERSAMGGRTRGGRGALSASKGVLVARYAGKPELRSKVEAAIRVQQNNDAAVAYGTAGALILEKVVLGHTVEEALAWAVSEGGLPADLKALVERAVGTRTTPLRELTYEPVSYMNEMVSKHMAIKDELPPFSLAVWCNGPACGNPAAFTNVAMAAAHFGSEAGRDAYVAGVRANLMAGGDNCSRSLLIGALLAAQGGVSSLPAEWIAQVSKWAEYEALVDKLLAAP